MNIAWIIPLIFESALSAAIFYIIFAMIEFLVIVNVANNVFMNTAMNNIDIIKKDIGIKRNDENINKLDKVQKTQINNTINEFLNNEFDRDIASKNKEIKESVNSNLLYTIYISIPLISITILSLIVILLYNRYFKKLNVQWSNLLLTVVFIMILITLYECLIVFYYFYNTKFVNFLDTFYNESCRYE